MSRNNKNAEHYFTAHPKSKTKFGLIRTCLRGRPFEFLTGAGVFSKRRVDLGTRLLIETMILPEKGCVLDIGCGYGPVGISAAAFNPYLRVILVDVNSRAVWLAKQNVEKNRVRNAEVRRGCLYEPVNDLAFDSVLSNPPVSVGMRTVKAIITDAPAHMASEAIFQMVLKSKISRKTLNAFFDDTFGNVEVLARGSGYRVLISKRR